MPPNIKTTTDKSAAVDTEYHWIDVDEHAPPVGPKLQLINKYLGVATYGTWSPGGKWTHWAPLPTFRNDPHETRPD